MSWLVVVVTLVAVVALALLHLKNRRTDPGPAKPLQESKPAAEALVQPPARQPIYFKRYRPDDSSRE